MALELKATCEKCGRALITSEVAYIYSYECTHCRAGEFSSAQTAKANLCSGRVGRSLLVPLPLMFDSIGKKTLVADLAHVDQQATRAVGKEFPAQTCQRWRFGSAEHVRREREIELIDQTPFQQGAKKCRSAFACKPSHVVFVAERCQHNWKIDVLCIA
jgi:hypothetical protein